MSRKKRNKKNKLKCENVSTAKIKHKKFKLNENEFNELCSNIKFPKQRIKIIGIF